MVHGLGQDHRLFSGQLDAFRADYRLLLVDLPGHGGSAAVPGPYGPAEYAAGVLAALDAAAVETTHYWGSHTGAAAGLLLALGYARRIDSLILEGAVVPGDLPPSVTRWVERIRATVRRDGLGAARAEWFDEAEWFDGMRTHPERCRAATHRAMVESFPGGPWLDDSTPAPVAPVAPRLGAIARPALIFNGEHDLPDFLAQAERIGRALPGAVRAVIPGAGGFPGWEDPDAVNARVRAFLDSIA